MILPTYYSKFPIKGKKPLVSWSPYQSRFPTQEEIVEWGQRFSDHDWGIITGKLSKIFVLDDDGGLSRLNKPLPKTLTQQTPSGGTHYIFKWVDELDDKITTDSNIYPDVDIRGEGGFICFYGFNKPYHTVPLADPPKWLIEKLNSKRKITQSIQERLNSIKPGHVDKPLTSLAGSLFKKGFNFDEVYSLLLPKANVGNHTEHDLHRICKSVERYHVLDTNDSDIDNFLQNMEVIDWICEPIIAKKTLGFVAGLPETMKTWSLIDLAVECARGGGRWLGRFPTSSAKVLFIDQERFKGETQRRFRAIIAGKGLSSKDLRGRLFVKSGTTIRVDLQQSYDAFKKEITSIRPDIIIVDSFATFHTREENNRKDIQEVLEKIKEIRNEFGCTFLFIDHENKGAFHAQQENEAPSAIRMAGSIAKPAAAEMILTVRRHDSESSFVYHTKSTLASTIAPFLVRVRDLDPERTKIVVEAI